MPEGYDPNTQKQSADNPAALNETPPIAHKDKSGAKQEDKDSRPHWADRVIAIFTGLIFLTYIASNYFSCRQMKLTERAMEQSEKNNIAAISAQKEIAQSTLTASQNNFEKSSKASSEQMRLDQRAWVGAIEVSLDSVEIGKPLYAHVALVNSGKTVAKHVVPHFYLKFSEIALNELPPTKAALVSGSGPSIGILVPGAQYHARIETGGRIAQEIDKTNIAIFYTYIWAEIEYSDIFGQPHHTYMCNFRKGTDGDFIQCPFHNDAT